MLQPIGDRVIVKVIEEEEKTAGGLVLTSAAKDKSQVGEIVSISDNCCDCVKGKVQAGDKVIFEKFAGSEVEDNGETYLVLNTKDIMALVK